MNRILAINPPIEDFSAFDLFYKPYGLLNIISLIELYDIKVDLIDCMDKNDKRYHYSKDYSKAKTKFNGTGKFYKKEILKPEVLKDIDKKYFLYGIDYDEIVSQLSEHYDFNYNYILISCTFTYHYKSLIKIKDILKKLYPNSKLILGGIYPTVYNSHANTLGFDKVISGDFYNLLKYFEKESFVNINNYIEKSSKKLRIDSSLIYKLLINSSLENIITPSWHKYDTMDYGIIRVNKGCVNKCKYCASKIIYNKFSYKTNDIIIEELKYFKSRNIKNIAFYDDAFLLKKTKLIDLFNKIKKIDYGFTFYLPNAVHIRYADKDILQYLKAMDFKMIRFGFETIDFTKFDRNDYKFNLSHIENLLLNIENLNIDISLLKFYLLIGLPNQTIKEVKSSINYLLKKGVKPYFAMFSPIPNTSFYNELLNDPNMKINIKEPLFQNPSIYSRYYTIFKPEIIQEMKYHINKNILLKI